MLKKTTGAAAVIMAIVLATSCGSGTAKDGNTTNTGDTVLPPETKTDTLHAGNTRLECRELPNDSLEIPHSLVILSAAGKETIIDTVNTCSTISIEEYRRYQIPGTAISACGGWYAGGGDYFYLLLRDGKPVVYAGWQDEGQDENDNGYHWEEKKIKTDK
ncbi:MAG: hypothetical protein JNM88_07515 [Chitinophagaceae bacterium]|nr:hypothetical protein [Chitinophagaceae bacterium]